MSVISAHVYFCWLRRYFRRESSTLVQWSFRWRAYASKSFLRCSATQLGSFPSAKGSILEKSRNERFFSAHAQNSSRYITRTRFSLMRRWRTGIPLLLTQLVIL